MEIARKSPRIPVYIEADLFSDGNMYAGFIGNLSASGIYAEIIHSKGEINFPSGKILDLEFLHPSGEPLYLKCRVTWSQTKVTDSKSLIIGMEIIDPPLPYKEFFNALA